MVKTKNVIAALGVVAGFGVAALPLATYADATNPLTNAQAIRATVDQVFALTVTPNTEISRTDISTGLAVEKSTPNTTLEHVIEVSGNAYSGYTLTMGSNNAFDSLRFVKDKTKNFGDADRYNNDVNIPAGTSIAANTSNWAYRKSTTPLTDQSGSIKGDYSEAAWTKVKANTAAADEIMSNANTGHVSFDDKAYVNFGVSVDGTEAAGAYEGEVIYTATATF